MAGYEWIVVTSATAVRVLAGRVAVLPSGVRVAAVGDRTAQAARDAGWAVHLVPEDASARGLVDAFPDVSGAVLFPRSDIAAPTVVDGLRARGIDVDDVVAYRTVGTGDEPVSLDTVPDAVLVTSGSVAREIARRMTPLDPRTLVACIGPGTAADARAAGLPVHVVAPARSAESLLDAVVETLNQNAPEQEGTSVTGRFPQVRPRRLRATPAMRRLVAETRLHPSELVLPMFIREGATSAVDITSMPGVQQHSLDSFRRALVDAADAGIGGVNLFGVPVSKDATGSGATDPDGILNVAIRVAREEVGDALVVQSDLCLDEFTDHGHCGVLAADGSVDNDATLLRYRDMAVAQAEAGAELVCMSGMMDGQIAAARDALDTAGFTGTALLAYAAKYASAFYGPFREAVSSSLVGDRRTYQIDAANGRQGLREVALDVDEGADIVMVKPAMSYLDVLASTAATSPVPVWAYQISGEYAMITAAAQNGWIDRDAAAMESLVGIKRAGADAILTYFAVDIARTLRQEGI